MNDLFREHQAWFLRDVVRIFPLAIYVHFPDKEDYLTEDFITLLTTGGFYDETKILNRLERKYYNYQIGTRSVEDFYNVLNTLIEENYSKYLMDLVTISETYSIQNVDTRDSSTYHYVDSEGENTLIQNNTPGNKLNIANIKAGESASSVAYSTDKGTEYHDTFHQESTSALNTTQSNVEEQLKINRLVQDSLNEFLENLGEAFSIVIEDYYE